MYEDFFEIAIFVAEPPKVGEMYEKTIMLPFPYRSEGVNCYRFVFGGFDFITKVDKRRSKLHMPMIAMKLGCLNIIHIPFESAIIGKYISAFKEARRLS